MLLAPTFLQMITIGGENGHVKEIAKEPVFTALYKKYRWKMIRNCTGRFTCRDHLIVSQMAPLQLIHSLNGDKQIVQFEQYYYKLEDETKNPMIIIPFTDEHQTGLITYVKEDAETGNCHYVHTLNAPSGFQRKLEAMKISLCEKYKI